MPAAGQPESTITPAGQPASQPVAPVAPVAPTPGQPAPQVDLKPVILEGEEALAAVAAMQATAGQQAQQPQPLGITILGIDHEEGLSISAAKAQISANNTAIVASPPPGWSEKEYRKTSEWARKEREKNEKKLARYRRPGDSNNNNNNSS